MDKTLDEMISTRPKTARRTSAVRKGAAAKAQVLGKAAPGPVQKARAAAANAKPAAPLSEKIVVSNLPADVNEQQLKELFTTTIGPLRDVTLTYDHNGRSKGVATILFQRKGDGSKAYAQYHNRLIDGS
ncbi:hypothetical protein PUNSTDRAFT_52947 [Punctularia strigosozonata HHB-11173 SS5]|uniref:uncharacterized protein n=1 Tax=Punctularia strigosozonata (strain HHB-11173) TaxID=741275 RepID=UPI0004416718|nr:uncharacterized protein PUNSTDRAFT_52947 [Punctularia strigosozonata HHB-11173 SS5]EIN08615.1 hypothetical protein PUNSTDRAFT_52947 [Punctularia strigosozonata HHB-11173 SS5]